MKTGRTINELAAEITRQMETRKDLLANTKSLDLVAVPQVKNGVEDQAHPVVKAAIGPELYGINELAHEQVGAHTEIPRRYYEKMREKAPGLLVTNVNHWFSRFPADRLIRTLDGNVRAFLSSSYRPLDNWDLLEATLPILADGGLDILSCEVTERRLYIKAVDHRIHADVPKGGAMGDGKHTIFDTVCPAVIISNSEVGHGTLSVESGVYTRACTNMALFSAEAFKRRHVGAKHQLLEGQDVRAILTDETKQQTDKALWMQTRDVVKAALSEIRFGKIVDSLKEAAGVKIAADDVIKVVDLTSTHYRFSDVEKKSVMAHLIEGGDLSKYGLHSAVTRTAQDLPDYDRATEFEAIGAQIVTLDQAGWKRLAPAS